MNTVYKDMWEDLKNYIEQELRGCDIGATMSFSEALQGTNWLNHVKEKMQNLENSNKQSIKDFAQEQFYDKMSFS